MEAFGRKVTPSLLSRAEVVVRVRRVVILHREREATNTQSGKRTNELATKKG